MAGTAGGANRLAVRMRFLVVIPFLNEERYLPATLASLAAQRRAPEQLLLIDDGSSDGSPALAEAFARERPWARALRRPPRPPERDRLARAAELKAFEWGLEQASDDWDVVAKLDADLELTPDLFEEMERRFDADPALGLAGPFVSVRDPATGAVVPERCRPDHVYGAVKFYRRECYEAIAPIPAILGWDTIDEVRARLAGWRTESSHLPGGDTLHLRVQGSQDGLPRGWRRWGECAWGYGEHPLHIAAVAVQRLVDEPRVIGSANYVAGWAGAALRRAPRAEKTVRAEVRRDQMERLRRRLRAPRGARAA